MITNNLCNNKLITLAWEPANPQILSTLELTKRLDCYREKETSAIVHALNRVAGCTIIRAHYGFYSTYQIE